MASAHPPDEAPEATGVGRVIDPTKNVLDLVRAESKYQDAMREASDDYHSAMLEQAILRLDERDDLRERYETRIADMLAKSVDSTSALVSSQLLSIQAAFNTRLVDLERFRYENSGKASVADPALAAALSEMAVSIKTLRSTGDISSGNSSGRLQLWALIVGGGFFLAAIITLGINIASAFRPVVGT